MPSVKVSVCYKFPSGSSDLIRSHVGEQTLDSVLEISTPAKVILLSLLSGHTPLSACQHLVERVPADAGPANHKRQEVLHIENIGNSGYTA